MNRFVSEEDDYTLENVSYIKEEDIEVIDEYPPPDEVDEEISRNSEKKPMDN